MSARREASDPGRVLFDAAVAFLTDHRLGFEPASYAFAYRIVSMPDGPLAQTVVKLTEGGVRLTERDVASLTGGCDAVVSRAVQTDTADEQAAELIARTRSQMEDFSGLVEQIRAETSGFGRDLAASVDAIDPAIAPDLIDLTAAMLTRVRSSEQRLNAATAEAAALRQQLAAARDDARVDVLTGLANRRALLEVFHAHQYGGETGCFGICDVDHFKRINDQFGHAVGDRVLAAIAGTLSAACPEGQVARYGGEEFAVLLPHVSLTRATEMMDRARATVAAKRYRLRDSDAVLGMISFSAGVIALEPSESFEDAFARADALLYAAKNGGRNQVRS